MPSQKIRRIVKGVCYIILVPFVVWAFWTYSHSFFWILYGVFILLIATHILGRSFDWIRRSIEKPTPILKKVYVIFFIILLILPWWSNPIWHVMTHQERYGKSWLVLMRDWVLLDQQGKNLISDWYYDNAPYGMEKQRSTRFQKALICFYKVPKNHHYLIDLKQKSFDQGKTWKNFRFGSYYYELENLQQGLEWVEQDRCDILLVDFSHKDDINLRKYRKYKDRILYWTNLSNQPETYRGFRVLTPRLSSLFEEERVVDGDGFLLKKSPLTMRQQKLWEEGIDIAQNKLLNQAKDLFVYSFYKEVAYVFTPLAALSLLSLTVACFACFLRLSLWNHWIPLGVIFGVLWMQSDRIALNLNTWKHILNKTGDFENPLLELQYYRKVEGDPKHADIDLILSQPMSQDKRVVKWQIQLLGTIYPYAKSPKGRRGESAPSQREIIEEHILKILDQYEKEPVNVRYMLIDSFARYPFSQAKCLEKIKQEKHLYVRWYAEGKNLNAGQIGYPKKTDEEILKKKK